MIDSTKLPRYVISQKMDVIVYYSIIFLLYKKIIFRSRII